MATDATHERDQVADERDQVADERDQVADERDQVADERDLLAHARERWQDDREADLDAREARSQREGLRRSRDTAERLDLAKHAIRESREQLDRSQQRLARVRAGAAREQTYAAREQGDVDREVRRTGADLPPSPRVAERWRRLGQAFSDRADAVPAEDWQCPAPCAGWTARDVVAHLAGWMPALWFPAVGRPLPELPDPASDPAGCWAALREAVQDLLEAPAVASLPTVTRAGSMTLERLVEMTGLMDVLVHTWDLARATGQDERLDPYEVAGFLADLQTLPPDIQEEMRGSGHYGPRVDVPPDADPQTRLLALTGRRNGVRGPEEPG